MAKSHVWAVAVARQAAERKRKAHTGANPADSWVPVPWLLGGDSRRSGQGGGRSERRGEGGLGEPQSSAERSPEHPISLIILLFWEVSL